jgi:threonine dehydrogenase-like Zn-dependent dehydrogenase
MAGKLALVKDVNSLKRGDRVVVPFTIVCGSCTFCQNKIW